MERQTVLCVAQCRRLHCNRRDAHPPQHRIYSSYIQGTYQYNTYRGIYGIFAYNIQCLIRLLNHKNCVQLMCYRQTKLLKNIAHRF